MLYWSRSLSRLMLTFRIHFTPANVGYFKGFLFFIFYFFKVIDMKNHLKHVTSAMWNKYEIINKMILLKKKFMPFNYFTNCVVVMVSFYFQVPRVNPTSYLLDFNAFGNLIWLAHDLYIIFVRKTMDLVKGLLN